MSVLIKDMEKPKSCCTVIDGEFEYCPFLNTDDDCVLLLKKGICEGTWEEQYSKCPLIEATEPCEDVVSRKAVEDMLKNGFPARGMWEIEGDVVKQTVCDVLVDALMDLGKLPSAQTEIFFADNRAFGFPVKRCERTGLQDVDDDDFCSRAEREENR